MEMFKNKSKYGNKKQFINGIRFDSKKEALRYLELKDKEAHCIICDLQLQVKFELIPAQYEHFEVQGKHKMLDRKKCTEKSCSYIADFVYSKDGNLIVEDVKGMRTDVYRIKKKMMLDKHNIVIQEV